MTATIISGGNLRDEIFELDAQYLGEPIVWNVTRIRRDALTGAFGKTIRVPMSALPPLGTAERLRIDWSKVETMIGAHLHTPEQSPLDIPVLQVALLHPDGVTMRIPVDGNHRICARRIVREPDFECYVVPHKLERLYRLTETTIAGTTRQPT